MEAKRRLTNFNFAAAGSHVAMVDKAANGIPTLVLKAYGDATKYTVDEGFVPLKESGLALNISLEDVLWMFTSLSGESIETLTQSITKAESPSLKPVVEAAVALVEDPNVKEDLVTKVAEWNEDDCLYFVSSAVIVKDFLKAGSTPLEPTTNVEKHMTESVDAVEVENTVVADEVVDTAPEANTDVVKSLEETEVALEKAAAEAEVLKETIARLEKAEDARKTEEFVAKTADISKSFGIQGENESEAIEALATHFKALSETSPEAWAAVEGFLVKAAESASAAESFVEKGESGEPEVVFGDEALEKAAEELRAADPTLSSAQAITKALEINPSLYS